MPRIYHLNIDQNRHQSPLGLALRFAEDHRDALLNASELLGGPGAERRCMKLLDDLREAKTLTRRLRAELVDLHRLLVLDRIDDLESVEAACFAEMSPADSRVHDICLLADRLHDLLRAIVDLDDATVDVETYLAAFAA